jgi:hypothetical protein
MNTKLKLYSISKKGYKKLYKNYINEIKTQIYKYNFIDLLIFRFLYNYLMVVQKI